MGINLGSLTKVFLGIGLGILTVSCLTATIFFGRYSNGFTDFEKYEAKVSFDSKSSMIDSAIAIAVLGCISFAAALAALILSVLIEGQGIILIIVGGVSSLFAFGCIVAEGIFTQKCFQNYRYSNYDYFSEYNHKGAQDYIKKSIKQLYEQAIINYRNRYPDTLQSYSFLSFSDIEKDILGKNHSNYPEHIITYADIWWSGNDISKNDDVNQYLPFRFYLKNNYIYSLFNETSIEDDTYDDLPIATLNYIYFGEITQKQKVCWINSDRSAIKCKKMNTYKEYEHGKTKQPFDNFEKLYDYYLNEKIVVGDCLSYKQANDKELDNVIYTVSSFPINFKLISNDQFANLKSNKNAIGAVTDSSNHYKISGKKWAKANYKQDKKKYDELFQDNHFILVPYKIKNFHDYIYHRTAYTNKQYYGTTFFFDEDYSTSFEDVESEIDYYYKYSNKGKVSPCAKKYYRSIFKDQNSISAIYSTIDDASPNNDLYQMALINMISQIVGIIFWACGKFIPAGGNNDASQNSEKGQNGNQDDA